MLLYFYFLNRNSLRNSVRKSMKTNLVKMKFFTSKGSSLTNLCSSSVCKNWFLSFFHRYLKKSLIYSSWFSFNLSPPLNLLNWLMKWSNWNKSFTLPSDCPSNCSKLRTISHNCPLINETVKNAQNIPKIATILSKSLTGYKSPRPTLEMVVKL